VYNVQVEEIESEPIVQVPDVPNVSQIPDASFPGTAIPEGSIPEMPQIPEEPVKIPEETQFGYEKSEQEQNENDILFLNAEKPIPNEIGARAPRPTGPSVPEMAVDYKWENVLSPLRGKILSVFVTAGQAVKKGDILLILGTPENEYKVLAHRDAIVSEIRVQGGYFVEAGSLLLITKVKPE
ncbi:MAG: biotin/lipoyl-binding protein, partial [Bacillota bacterium]|nr:biotin/lipoyl-binding protein [Bacillota bacterium]